MFLILARGSDLSMLFLILLRCFWFCPVVLILARSLARGFDFDPFFNFRPHTSHPHPLPSSFRGRDLWGVCVGRASAFVFSEVNNIEVISCN